MATDHVNQWLALQFNATPIPNIADNAAVSPLTQLWITVHLATPGVGGDQTVNEATFGGMARVAVPRTTAGWLVPASRLTRNVGTILFPLCIAGDQTVTHVSIGTASSGVGRVLYAGVLAAGRRVIPGVQLTFIPDALTVRHAA